MKRTLILILLMLNVISLMTSCFKTCNRFKYFIYEGIEIHLVKSFVQIEDSLLIQIRYLEPDFTAQKLNNYVPNSLLAFDCDKGWGGEKHPLTRISIKSDSDFTDKYLANQDLGEIVNVRGVDSNGNYVYDSLNSFNPKNVNVGYLYITRRPTIDKEHVFTIEFEKDNGEIVSAISDKITWE